VAKFFVFMAASPSHRGRVPADRQWDHPSIDEASLSLKRQIGENHRTADRALSHWWDAPWRTGKSLRWWCRGWAPDAAPIRHTTTRPPFSNYREE